MPDLLATRTMLANRVGPITDADDILLANHMLAYASAQARHYGWATWEPFNVPESVRFVVIEAAARGYYNPAGYKLERGDELTLQRDDSSTGGAAFTKSEIAVVRAASYQSGIGVIRLVRPDLMSDEVISVDASGSSPGSGGGGGSSGSDLNFG